MYFGNYGVAKKDLDKYLKSAVSQYPSTSNMVKPLKTPFKMSRRQLYHTY